jgi:hypothetical protein
MNQDAFTTQHLARADERRAHLEQLEDQITELAAHIHAATYRLLELIREYDLSEGWFGPGLNSCAHWLNWKCGISLGAAREKVRVAHALAGLPRISAAFRRGRVSYSKVRAMTRVATVDNEDYLLNIALHGTAQHVERLVRHYRQVKRTEALAEENARHAQRELSWHVDEDGYWVCRGRFTPEEGALIQSSLEAAMEAQFQEAKNVPAGTSDEELSDPLKPGPQPIASRRADALLRVAQAYGAGGENAVHGGERVLLHVHTYMDTLQADGAGAQAELEGHGAIAAETTRRLACDAGVVHWLEDKEGNALNLGRKTRSIPPAIRRALQRRDGGCRFPGCTCSRFVDAHHIRHWADGGETKMDNLVLLCRRHHRLVHEGGFGISHTASGKMIFSDPQGQDIPTAPEARFSGNVFSIFAAHRQAGLDITPQTPIPNWLGERMDDSMAVEGLLHRD